MAKNLKIMHIGQLIGGLDVYIRNSIIYNDASNSYVLVHGREDQNKPILREGQPIPEYAISLYRSLNPFKDLKALFQAVRLIRKERPDLIHCHSAKGGVIGRLAGWLTGTKTFYTPHAFSFLCTPSKFKRMIYLGIERFTKFNAFVLACSESEREMAVKEVGYRATHALVWHNAVPDASTEKCPVVPVSEPFVCYIGRPCYQKNPLFLLNVIHKVRERGCRLKFLLLGVGYHSPELTAMKQRIEELQLTQTIALEPWISHAECQSYVRQSLFYLTTSLYEGLPLAVIEAMSQSKAIIASDVVGNRDCVKNMENGYLLPLDADVFADKICSLATNLELLKTFSENSRKRFLNDFYIVNRIALLQDIYEAE